MQEYVKHLLDGCYLLFVEYLQEKKHCSLCPETVPRMVFTVRYFFVRSFRYTASYRHSYLVFQMYRGGGRPGL